MKHAILAILLLLTTSFSINNKFKATWYHTAPHKRIHRDYPTAAMNGVPRGTQFEVTNIRNGKSCIITVTDRMGNKTPNRIDLSHHAFGLIENHKYGTCTVIIKKVDINLKDTVQ